MQMTLRTPLVVLLIGAGLLAIGLVVSARPGNLLAPLGRPPGVAIAAFQENRPPVIGGPEEDLSPTTGNEQGPASLTAPAGVVATPAPRQPEEARPASSPNLLRGFIYRTLRLVLDVR